MVTGTVKPRLFDVLVLHNVVAETAGDDDDDQEDEDDSDIILYSNDGEDW